MPVLVSVQVTAEDAGRHDGTAESRAYVVAGQVPENGPLEVRAAKGKIIPVEPGQWVVRFAPGDLGVYDDGEYQRWFGGNDS